MRRLALALCLLAAPSMASAHSFLIKPDDAQPAAGSSVAFRVLMTETLFDAERPLPADSVEARLLGGQPIPLAEDGKALRGQLEAVAGTQVLAARAMPRYRGVQKGQPAGEPADTLRIDDFAKAIINLKTGDAGYQQRSGDRLELVLLDNPKAHAGPDAPVRIQLLLDGQPRKGRIVAQQPGRERLIAETDSEGVARLTLPGGGFWLLRSGYKGTTNDPRARHYEAGASLLFALD